MDETSALLRGEELRREAQAWRRLHAAAHGIGERQRRTPWSRLRAAQRKIADR